MIPEEHKIAMVTLLAEYVATHKFIPQGMLLDINLGLKPILDYDSKILGKSAHTSFREFFVKNPQGKGPTTVLNIFTDMGMSTVKDVVTFGIGHKYGITGAWTRIPRCGQRSRDLIDKWLATLNLHRGMNF